MVADPILYDLFRQILQMLRKNLVLWQVLFNSFEYDICLVDITLLFEWMPIYLAGQKVASLDFPVKTGFSDIAGKPFKCRKSAEVNVTALSFPAMLCLFSVFQDPWAYRLHLVTHDGLLSAHAERKENFSKRLALFSTTPYNSPRSQGNELIRNDRIANRKLHELPGI